MERDEKEFRCTDIAWKYGVPLVGTATRADLWFLIEYTGRWGAKAFEQSDIPEPVKHHLEKLTHTGVESRIQLIRQSGSDQQDGVTLFIGQVYPLEPRLYEYRLKSYLDILNLDLAALAAGQPGDPGHLREEPVYLVCTNGRRDRCCAIYGPEAYLAMVEEAGESVWQSSHIGGHNQAPITLFFPHGVNYGHTTPTEARRLVQAYRDNNIVLQHFRGRVCFEPHVQAAEHFWRKQYGILELPGIKVHSTAETGSDEWSVVISDADGQKMETIHLRRRHSSFLIPITCSKTKERAISSFHRI
jgi:hypothetical protein